MKAIVLSAVMVGALSSVMLAGCVAYPGPAEVTIGWHGDRYWDGNRYLGAPRLGSPACRPA